MLPFSTPKQVALAVCGLLTGITCIVIGAHLSYSNIALQLAVQARNEYVKARLRKLFKD